VLAYVDTSALVKLVVAEPSSRELSAALDGAALVASAVVRTELRRAAARHPEPAAASRTTELLRSVSLIAVDDSILDHGGRLTPPSLRSLDAVHVATALTLGGRLDLLFTYDSRMIAAAEHHGIEVASPGSQ
jgi:predicted nucleic acid-binding protein